MKYTAAQMQLSIKIGIWLQKFCKGKEIQQKYDEFESMVDTTHLLKVKRESSKKKISDSQANILRTKSSKAFWPTILKILLLSYESIISRYKLTNILKKKKQEKKTLTLLSRAYFVKELLKKGQLIHHDGLSLKFISISIFLLTGYLDFDMTHIEWII